MCSVVQNQPTDLPLFTHYGQICGLKSKFEMPLQEILGDVDVVFIWV